MTTPRRCPRVSRVLSLLALLAALSALVRTSRAQIGDWATFPVGSSTTMEQSLVVVASGNTVSAFSCLTKTWAAVTGVYGTPARTLSNEHLIVRDGPLLHGYSPRTGTFASIYTSPGAVIAPSSSPQTFASAVVDGNRLYVFFALTGQWMTYTFASPPTVTMGRLCLLVTDGQTTWAISFFYGSQVQAPALAAPLRADGNMAFAATGNTLHGFAASTNLWTSLALAAAPTVSTITIGNTQPVLAAVQDGAAISLFSGHSGTFVTLPAAPSATVQLQRYVAVVTDGALVYGYSGLLGTYALLPAAAPPTVTMEQMFALVDDGAGITAYSPTTGTFATPLVDPGATILTKAQIAVASVAGGPVSVYSSMRNRWDPVPPVAGAASYANAVALVLVDPNGGVHGWSQRGSGWVFLPTAPIDTVVVGSNPPNTPETIFLRSGNTIHTWNPRTEAWRSATTAAPATLVRAHYQAILAHDGANAYGFSIWNDRWSVEPLPTGYATGTAQVQSAYVSDGTLVHAYGGFGQLTMQSEFPDFYRAASVGMPFRTDIVGEPGSLAILAASLTPAAIPLPFGTLLLDPGSLAILLLASVPNSGLVSYTMTVPGNLSGVDVHFQAAILGGSGLYFTNGVTPLFL